MGAWPHRRGPLLFCSLDGGLAVLVEGLGAIAVSAVGVAGSVKVNFSTSTAPSVLFYKEVRVVLGGIMKNLTEKSTAKN